MNLTDKITVTNEDNMELMSRYPDNYFDLAIVDPPYGLDFSKYNRVSKRSNGDRYISNDYKKGDWDKSSPNEDYFEELKRVSKHQIVWGGNYFPQLWTNGCKGFIFWYKGNPVPNFADGELAYCSMNKVAKQFDFRYYGNLEGNSSAKEKIHPTQKPEQLYNWLLDNYAKEGDKILDTHLGSGSIAIACHNRGFELTACELDKEYYDNFVKRFKQVTAQQSLF
jgi:site-specific DNA-methyltransferase (adenine-specific)